MNDSKTLCILCKRPMRVSEGEAERLGCRGIHLLEEKGHLIPIRNRGLKVGTRTIMREVEYGLLVEVGNNCDLFQCRIGNRTKIKHYVEIQGDVVLGQRCKVESYVFIPSGTRVGNNVFFGPRVTLCNDRVPRATGSWKISPVIIEDYVSLGAGAIILPGVTLHEGCIIGAGAIVVKDVAAGVTVVGNPANPIKR